MEMSVDQCMRRTDALYDRIATHLRNVLLDDSPRGRLVSSMSTMVIGHGLAIRLLVSAEQFASATALLRVQFEAVVRAIWLHFAAAEESVEDFALLVSTSASHEAADTPKVPDMLNAIDRVAPPQVGEMLRDLKVSAWGAMNSRVYGGIHPVIRASSGYSSDYVLGMLRNANGLTTMAAMLIAILSGDERVSKGMVQIQMDHLDCLPPLAS
jgi:hypothetical protein